MRQQNVPMLWWHTPLSKGHLPEMFHVWQAHGQAGCAASPKQLTHSPTRCQLPKVEAGQTIRAPQRAPPVC